MAGIATQKVGNPKLLVEAYLAAIKISATKNHMSVLILQLCLARLQIDHAYDFADAEALLRRS
jgi:hypothetical protein